MELDPELWELPHLRAWVARHEFDKVFAYLTKEARILTQRQLSRLVESSQSDIHEVIQGRQPVAYHVLERYSVGLNIPRGYMGIAFTNNVDSEGKPPELEPGETETDDDGGREDDSVERRRFVANSAAVVFGSAVLGRETDFAIPYTHPEIRSSVGIDYVRSVRDLTAFARSQDARHGRGSSADLMARELPDIYRMLKVSMTDAVRDHLRTAAADAYMVAGVSRASTGNLRAGRALFARALKLAKQADNRSLMATVLVFQAIFDGREGNVDDALKLVQIANVATPDGLSASNAAQHEAWLYAKLGDRDQATKFLKKARDLYEKNHTDKPLPPWLTKFNIQGPALIEATFRELSAHDSVFLDRAVPAAVAAVQKVPEHDRNRTLVATSRAAELHLRAGERKQGLKLAQDAVDTAEGLYVVGHYPKQVLGTDLTRMLVACRDSTAADLTRRIALIAA